MIVVFPDHTHLLFLAQVNSCVCFEEDSNVDQIPKLKTRYKAISRGTELAYRAKRQFFAPERYTAGILQTDSLNSA